MREWRFLIYPTRLGFWRWYATGRDVFNVSYPSSHLPRRSAAACEAAAGRWVTAESAKKSADNSGSYTFTVNP